MTTATTSTAIETALHVPDDAATQEWDVDRYQQQYSFVWKYGSSLLDLIDWDNLTEGGRDGTTTIRVLDVGCGSGELAHAIAQRGASNLQRQVVVQGMDLDPNMIQKAQEQYQHSNPNVSFIVGDVRNFELPEPVDVIFSNAALHWIPPNDVSRAITSLSRALKSGGGQFVVEFGGKGNVETIVKAIQQVLSSRYGDNKSYDDFWYYPSIADFATVLQSHGIEVTQAQLFDRPTLLSDNENGMKNWLQMFGTKFWQHLHLSQQEQDQLLDDVCSWLRGHSNLYNEENRQWYADYRRIRIVGRKL